MTNLIGISGKKYSGKNTVADIIQYLTSSYYPEMEYWQYKEENKKDVTDSPYALKAFADKLKDITCLLIGCTREQLEDPEFKETPLGKEWWKLKVINRNSVEYRDYLTHQELLEKEMRELLGPEARVVIIKMTPRLLMQLLGTECGREIIHPQTWVNALFADYKDTRWISKAEFDIALKNSEYNEENDRSIYPNWIISDVRFPNEYNAIKERDGIVVRIESPLKPGDQFYTAFDNSKYTVQRVEPNLKLSGGYCYYTEEDNGETYIQSNQAIPVDKHESETTLDNHEFDYTIHNDGTIEDLVRKVEEMLKHFKIIKPRNYDNENKEQGE